MIELINKVKDACAIGDVLTIAGLFSENILSAEKRLIIYTVIRFCEEKKISALQYLPIFIPEVLAENDQQLAQQMISQCQKAKIKDPKIQKSIYQYYIKPKEDFFRKRFYDNLAVLQAAGLLFSSQKFDFETAKYQLNLVSSPAYVIEQQTDQAFGAIMLINQLPIDTIVNLLGKVKCLYWIFEDVENFYYTLIFEDCFLLKNFCMDKKIIIFSDLESNYFSDFFKNPQNIIPSQIIDPSMSNVWQLKIDQIKRDRAIQTNNYVEQLNQYYSDKMPVYYANLLRSGRKKIKILGLASKVFFVSYEVSRKWIDGFCDFGYSAELLSEQAPYELIDRCAILKKIWETKPDIVFSVNLGPDEIFGCSQIPMPVRDNIVWIIRYRDLNPNFFKDQGCERKNIFISCLLNRWMKEFKSLGFDPKQLWSSPEGVDVEYFSDRAVKNADYAVQLSSVNNVAGNEQIFLKKIKGSFNSQSSCAVIDVVYQDLLSQAQESQRFYFEEELIEKIVLKCANKAGIGFKSEELKYIVNGLLMVEHALYRAKLIEWIVDAKIVSKISLWGTGWSNLLKLKKISHGAAAYDKLPLIYRNSLISLSDSPTVGIHERTFEILASKGFPLVKRAKFNRDEVSDSICAYFKEDQDIVLFDSKDELLTKIQYYLDNPQKRNSIMRRGQIITQKRFNSKNMPGIAMDLIKKYYAVKSRQRVQKV